MLTLDIGKYRQKKLHRDTVVRMRYSPSGRYLVSADKSGEIIISSQADMRNSRRYYSLTETLTDVWFSEDEKWLMVGHQGGKIRIFEIPKMKHLTDILLTPDRDQATSILSGTSRPILNYVVMVLCPQNTGTIFAVLEFRDFFLLRKDDYQVTYINHSPGNIIEQTAMTLNGKKIFFGDDFGIIYRYQLEGKAMRLMAEHREMVDARDSAMRKTVMETAPGIAALALTADGRYLASTSYSGGAQIWDTDQNPEDAKMKPIAAKEPRQEGRTRGVGFYPRSTQLALGSDDGIFEIWDFITRETLYQASCPESIRSVDISPVDGTCAIGGKDGGIFLLPCPGHQDDAKKGWLKNLFSPRG